MKASVVIPTKNGGMLFARVLDALLRQKAPWDYEILVVDSGSTDKTLRYCEERNVNVISIPPSEFGHGQTRNFGISKTKGEFVALITQDALPASNEWLFNLVSAVEQAPDVAGAFGRHLPYPDADPYMVRDLKLHFDGFLAWPAVLRKSDNEPRYEAEIGYRQIVHFFSDNNACLRRSVWEKYPYPDVDFAEDQIWAETVIKAGFGKAYADNAAVYHSHRYSVIEAGRRAFDESVALNGLFGYQLCPTVKQLLLQTGWCGYRDARHTLFLLRNFARNELKKSLKNIYRHLTARAFKGFFSTLVEFAISIKLLLISKYCWGLVFFLFRAPAYNFARQLGFYLGNKQKKLPKWLLHLLSLDHALKIGGGGGPADQEDEEKEVLITDIGDLKDGRPYKVVGGEKHGSIFVYSSGHKRSIPTMQVYYRTYSDNDLQDVSPYVESSIPNGAPLPCDTGSSLDQLLTGKDTDAIRESLCAGLRGVGYEIGAGDRPTRVPLSAQVKYIDKFTFEGASDGSFIGKSAINFVHVSVYEAMDSLNSIEDGSADFFIACHVIEHVPNVMASLKSAYKKLKKGGELFMVVPDKRYMFDQGRAETTLEHFLVDEIRGGDVETLEHYVEYFRRSAADSHFMETALAGFESGRDIHMHVFTPESMGNLLAYLHGNLNFTEHSVLTPSQPEVLQEFYVRIKK
ncbi:MAG: glycosyltransferase [Sulfurimicrobium sp.]|nr:glycosyltransferase [Sulfurimicrobium sp.]